MSEYEDGKTTPEFMKLVDKAMKANDAVMKALAGTPRPEKKKLSNELLQAYYERPSDNYTEISEHCANTAKEEFKLLVDELPDLMTKEDIKQRIEEL